jgi:nitrite reductase [NAD(P)H] small subunit
MIRLCSIEDVPVGEGRSVRVGSEELALFRTPEGWYAAQAACPHLGGPLADGILGDRSVVCPLHERRFDLASGAPLGHGCAALRTFALEQAGGEVFLLGARPDSRQTQPNPEV